MKAAGLSAHQILAPLIVASLGVAVLPSPSTSGSWSSRRERSMPGTTTTISRSRPVSGVQSNVWIKDGDDLVHAGIVSGRGAGLQLQDVTIYDRERRRAAPRHRRRPRRPGARRLAVENVRTYDAGMNIDPAPDGASSRLPRRHARPLHARQGRCPTSATSWRCGSDIADLEAAGRPTDEARAGLWHKISGPLSTVLMPLLAAVAAFGLARSGQVLLRAADRHGARLRLFRGRQFQPRAGQYRRLPAWLAAWAPFLLFLLIGEAVLIRSEE